MDAAKIERIIYLILKSKTASFTCSVEGNEETAPCF